MQDMSRRLMARANNLLHSDALRPKAKALLLLKLCQVHAMMSSEKTQDYWQQLTQMRSYILEADKPQLAELGLMFDSEKGPPKGFAGEKIGEIRNVLTKPGLSERELREFLNNCCEEVKKRFWPGGKQAIWEQMVLAWKTIDRKQALVVSGKLSPALKQAVIRRMNQEKPLSVEEWQHFADANSLQDAVKIILVILDDPNPKLVIPANFIAPVVNMIKDKLISVSNLHNVLDKINKFIWLVVNNENRSDVCDVIARMINAFANSPSIGQHWAEKFNSVLSLIIVGVSTGVIAKNNLPQIIKVVPKPMQDFVWASCFALLANPDTVRQYFSELMTLAGQKAEAEAWFLVMLAERKFGELAYKLASESTHSGDLMPRIRGAWLCNDAETASAKLSFSELGNDPVAHILHRAPGKERTSYLREATNFGHRPLPAGLWAVEKEADENKGLWASLWRGGKTVDEITNEYLKRNPLYASYRMDTPPQRQFSEYLRFKGYGEYGYLKIDPILLKELVNWGNEHPEEVKGLLQRMWAAIQPEDDILKVDFLRNAIFSRCTNVLAADPEVLVDFVMWLKKSLVDRSLNWQVGNTQYTVHYPKTVLASMCIQGALAVQNLSPERRDRLVEIGLTRFQADDSIGEVGAQLYNSGKEILDIQLPWKTPSTIIDGWQTGIVKNAIPSLFEEVVQATDLSELEKV